MLTGELKYPLNLKVRFLASWLCTAVFNGFLYLVGDSYTAHSSSMESSVPLLRQVFTSWWTAITSSLQWKVPTHHPVFAAINHTELLQQMTCPCGQNSRVSCQALTVWPCHAAPLRECFKCTNWVMFPAAWDTYDELSDTRTSHNMPYLWRCAHQFDCWQRTALFLWDQGPKEAACWRPHQASKKCETSLSPHYATILSPWFRRLLALFMLVHGETLWALKSWGR